MIKLLHGDCLEIMPKLIEEGIQVDAIITDPPYNISKQNNFESMGRAGIDFGEWDKNFNLTSWIDIISPLVSCDGSIVIFNDWKNMTTITQSLESNNFEIKDLIRWKKTNPMPRNIDRRFVIDYEVAVYAVKCGGNWVFNRKKDTYEIPEIVGSITPLVEKNNSTSHPTQKPIYVMEWLIERLSNVGQTILDPLWVQVQQELPAKNLKEISLESNLKKNISKLQKIEYQVQELQGD
jgi:site-specific DNA-methyltransferase (adenine-specific)/modification methylase